MNEVFISWSGEKANKYANFLEDVLNQIFGRRAKTFYSGNIESGTVWLDRINQALEESKIGIIVLTKESMKKPWVNFEAGAIFKADTKNTSIIPICVDISFKDLENHPLRFFQSRYDFTWDSMMNLFNYLKEKLQWQYQMNLQDIQKIQDEFSRFLDENKDLDLIEDLLHKNQISIYEKGCFMAEIPEEKFWTIRQAIIEKSKGTVILAGQSLEDALGERGIISIVEKLKICIISQAVTEIKILITDPSLFSNIQNFDILESSPLGRVSLTMDTLISEIFPICQEKRCKIKVFFIPLLEIDHAVINEKFMIFRSTKLWTRDGNYKGSFMIYRNDNMPNSEYTAHKNYLEKLMDNSTKIDLEIDSYASPDDGQTMKRHKAWRKAVKEAGYSVVQLYKLYHAQIVNYVADDWRKEQNISEVFKGSKDIKIYDDLFKPENLLNDDTQKVLLPYIKKTKELFESAIRKYDSSIVRVGTKEIQRSGVMIFPSLDLGFPNNIQRLAGGFATGMLVMWKCGTPIIPVDATVNVCSSSVFELCDFDTNMEDKTFIDYIEQIMFKATKGNGYSFSFDSGNHFLMIAQDIKSRKLYLVLHSSANEFKDSYMGLYPVENNWYSNVIRTNPSPYAPERYIRYIKDHDATYFIENAHKLEKYNIQIHNWFADAIGKEDTSKKGKTFHHYYMPTDNSIAIGTYVEEPGTTVPLFSNVGKDIYMFKIGKGNWKIRLGGKDVCLVPHGWGQVIDNVDSITVDNEHKIIRIDDDEYMIHSKVRIKNGGNKHVREFRNGKEFLEKGNTMIKGEIVQTLKPIYLYCSRKKGKINEITQ